MQKTLTYLLVEMIVVVMTYIDRAFCVDFVN